jgi:site-specific DNA recombinase
MKDGGSTAVRCAVYTRKSTDEGLDQAFNSLDAQREACVAFIASQAGLGWKLVPTHYDDGGISGGTMERPALQRLLEDIRQNRVDVIVVYKIDRLTRSLTDFAKMVEVFDANTVSFVSVTQQFNTTNLMGRLTLNVLLSFAQFEREVTAERIRDKIAASKQKGMWMGGVVPLGYRVEDRKLSIEENEAATVRHLFRRYLELRSVRALSQEAIASNLPCRVDKARRGGRPFGRGNLYHLLSNPIYVGKIKHHDKLYVGEHQAIIEPEAFEQVQALLKDQAAPRRTKVNIASAHMLTGLVFDGNGHKLRSTHANKQGRRYNYYVSRKFVEERGNGIDSGWRLPATHLDGLVFQTLRGALRDQAKLSAWLGDYVDTAGLQHAMRTADQTTAGWDAMSADQLRATIRGIVSRVELKAGVLVLMIDRDALMSLLIGGARQARKANATDRIISIEHPMSLRRRGVETRMQLGNDSRPASAPDRNLINLIGRAYRYLKQLTDGSGRGLSDIAAANQVDPADVSRTLPLAFLSPKIVDAILSGQQPVELTAQRLSRLTDLPFSWTEQTTLLGR